MLFPRTSPASRLAAAASLALVLAWAAPADASPAAPDESRLTLERIFQGREFSAARLAPVRWLADGASYVTAEPSPDSEGGRDIVVTRAETGAKRVLVPAAKLVPPGESRPLALEDFELSADLSRLLVFTNSKRVWRQNTRGDFWALDVASGRLRKLGAEFPESSLQFAKLSPDGRAAAYVHGNDLYRERLDGPGAVTRLTFDGSETIVNGTADWVYEEEFGIRDGFRWSPDGAAIAFWRFDAGRVPVFSMIDNTSGLYPRVLSFRHPKAGETNSGVRVGVVPAGGGPAVWLKVPGDGRRDYIARVEWAGPREILVQHLNRAQNALDLLSADPGTGDVRTVLTERDDAWVDVQDPLVSIRGGRELLWLSERDGWSHVYRVPRAGDPAGAGPTLVTPGAYDVLDIQGVDERRGWVYVTASPGDPTRRALYRHRLDGRGRLERVSPDPAPGVHSYRLSPDAAFAVHTFSALDRMPATELVALPSHRALLTLAGNEGPAAKLAALARTPAEFFKVTTADGVALDGWLVKPPDFDPAKRWPLIVYVYGEPAGQTTLNAWGGDSYLWHLYLAQHGFVVASLDNRGTPAPLGRAWRKSIYRQVGILASADQAAGVRALLESRPWLDPGRVGVWGWSGGGSMTLNAMFRHPGLYKAGIAVAFVADQRQYDTIYQERYMGLPADNERGYADGSPLTFAKDLRGDLLIVHGTGDDNVHYQNFEKLVNELVRHGKIFSMLSYPNRSHGISEGDGTTLHLYRSMERFWEERLKGRRD